MSYLFISSFFPSTAVPASTLTFYWTGTTTLAALEDEDGDALPNPVQSDAKGRFPAIYLDDGQVYRVVWKDRFGAIIDQVDPYHGSGTAGDTLPSFAAFATAIIPSEIIVVTTAAYRAGASNGGARYVYDAGVDTVFVAAHPGWATITANGRGFRLSPEQDIKLSMFGAVPAAAIPTGTDVTPIWLKAKDFLHYHRKIAQENAYYKTVLAIQFDEEAYYASQFFDLTDGVYHIKGMGNGPTGCTMIYMQGGQCGFVLQSWDTQGVGGFKANTPSGANFTIIEDITVQGAAEDAENPANRGFPVLNNPGPRQYITPPASLLGNELHCGFLIKCRATLIRCKAKSFGGWGIRVGADVTVGGNANQFILRDCEASFNWGGLLIQGGDTNAFEISGFNGSCNVTWGILDNSFLGGSGIGGHLQGNGSGQWNSGPYWLDFHPTTGAYVSGQNPRKGALVNYAGQTWRLMPDQQVAGSTTTPGTNLAVWTPYGIYDDVDHPSFPTWVSGISLVSGGAIWVKDINCKSSWVGLYAEYDQPLGRQNPSSRATAMGAFMSWDNGNFLNASNGKFWSKSPFIIGGEAAGNTTVTPLGVRFNDDDPNHVTTFEWSNHDMLYNYSGANDVFRVTGPATTQMFGRSVPLPHAFQILTPVFGSVANGRIFSFSSAVPSTGTWAVGDVVRNNGSVTPITTTREWICTTAGTPGTWTAFA
jgi:hypothetical protein